MATTTQRSTNDSGSSVPAGVRLHMFECGTLKCHVENIKMNQGLGEEYEIPVPWFVVEHPRGLAVIDGGNAAECATDARAHWGGISEVYWPTMTPEQACVPAMKAAGLDPADVRYVLQSHLHLDHTGALAAVHEFPNAQVIATRTEYEYAFAPDWFAAGGYIQKDYNKPGVPWALLGETEDGYDVFGDGTIRCWRTPGHAPGHQSFEVTLPNSGTMLLTVDAAYTMDHWDEKALPGFLASAVDAVRSVKKLHRIAARSHATVVTGHDPDAWPKFKQSPEAYD
ncbi:MAG: N-acyl homoserine lactonase family protein [Actinomycetota bacterium]|nr:N-acyl homoserine lactonase family protein [Actinomycetota bacterium]